MLLPEWAVFKVWDDLATQENHLYFARTGTLSSSQFPMKDPDEPHQVDKVVKTWSAKLISSSYCLI